MYIGPWQEYNLSKARASNRQHQQSLRNDIENAILSSLDPQTAQIALAAVNPYFNQNQNNVNKNGPSGNIIMNNIDNYSSHAQINGRIVRRKVNNKSSLPPLSHQSPLSSSSYQSASAKSPVLSSNPVSARDRSINSASPITTVRSTQSEPMPKRPSITIASNNTATTTSTTTKSSSISLSSNYNKISSMNNEIDGTKSIRSNTKSTNNKNNDNNNSNKSNNNNKGSTIGKVSGNNNKYINIDDGDDDDDDGNSNDKQNGNSQPPYNARAVVNLLRLERNNNAKNKIAMLTGWKVSDSSSSSRSNNNNNNSVGASSNVSSNDTKKRKIMIPPTSGVINKTDHVNMMKQLYLRGQGSDADYSNNVNYTNDNNDTQHSSTIIESSSATTNTTSTDKAISRLPSLTNHNMNNSGSSGVAYMSKDVMMIPQHHTSTISTSISTSFSHPVVEVKDFDLTDSDLGLVSKYFQTTTSAIPYNYNSRNGSITTPMMAMMIDNYSAGSNYILGIAESTSTSSYNGNINSNKANNYNNYDYNNSNSTSRGKHTTAYTFNDDDNEEYFDLENASQQQQQQRQQHLEGIKGLTEASVLSSTTTQQMMIMHNNEAIVDSFEGLLNWSNELELDIG